MVILQILVTNHLISSYPHHSLFSYPNIFWDSILFKESERFAHQNDTQTWSCDLHHFFPSNRPTDQSSCNITFAVAINNLQLTLLKSSEIVFHHVHMTPMEYPSSHLTSYPQFFGKHFDQCPTRCLSGRDINSVDGLITTVLADSRFVLLVTAGMWCFLAIDCTTTTFGS